MLPIGVESETAFASATANQEKYRNLDARCQGLYLLLREFNTEILLLIEDPVALKRAATSALHRLSHLQASLPGSASAQFKDVPPGHWFAKQLLDLRNLGIITGYPSGLFQTAEPSLK